VRLSPLCDREPALDLDHSVNALDGKLNTGVVLHERGTLWIEDDQVALA
jgi:hypothetical protein